MPPTPPPPPSSTPPFKLAVCTSSALSSPSLAVQVMGAMVCACSSSRIYFVALLLASQAAHCIATLIIVMIYGCLRAPLTPLPTSTILVGIPKLASNIRPITIRFVVRRLVRKVVLKLASDDFLANIQPLELRVGVPRGRGHCPCLTMLCYTISALSTTWMRKWIRQMS